MSKIKIKVYIKSKSENYVYEGKAIKSKNQITYIDKYVLTKIKLDKIVEIYRKKDYELKIKLKEGIPLEGKLKNKYGTVDIKTLAKTIKIEENKIKIVYDLIIDEHLIDTFTYNLEYSIDR
ncbi:MAG: DUF1934 family protein [Bacilli bacterium]|nr:DUF1934 family protein [Bacilli bacterium]